MLHHLSIPVDNPFHVANVLAEICQGHVLPFAICPGSYIVLSNDEYGTAIEFLPSGTQMFPGQNQVEYGHNATPPQYCAVHVAISVPLSQSEIEQIGAREGWQVTLGNRGQFQLIEFWLENKFLLELMPPTTVPQYVKSMTPQSFILLAIMMTIFRLFEAIASNLQRIRADFQRLSGIGEKL